MIFVSWKGQKIKKKELQEIVKKQQEQLDHMYCQIDNIYDVVRKQQKIIDEFYDDKKVREFKEKANGSKFLIEEVNEVFKFGNAYTFDYLAKISFINKSNKVQEEKIKLYQIGNQIIINEEFIEVHMLNPDKEFFIYAVYTLENDKLVNVDLNMYKKLYPEKIIMNT